MKRIATIGMMLSALSLFAATCVTATRQNARDGPWVGEVLNTGRGVVSDSKVHADITDAAGARFQASARTCPEQLAPGEKATYTVYMPGREPTGYPRIIPTDGPIPPFSAVIRTESIDHDDRAVAADIRVRLLERNLVRGYAYVELSNDSNVDYRDVKLCANLRAPDGTLIETAHAGVFPWDLRRGARTTAILYFNAAPAGQLEFVTQAKLDCCGTTTLDPDDFHVESRREVTDATGRRFALVVGQFENTTGRDLYSVHLGAQVAGSPADRADEVPVGCGIAAPAGELVPATFLLPLPDGVAAPDVVISGIQGFPGNTPSWRSLPVSHVQLNGNRVTATVSNPDDRFYNIDGSCFLLRDGNGQLVGAASTFAPGGIDAGESAGISAIVPSTRQAVRAEVIVYAALAIRVP
ncbi:MAG: hypothetical protein WEB52_13515 [Dehalococcoidia bacterium]